MNEQKLILESGLFNRAFYKATYADYLEDGADEIDHFLSKGVLLGFKPAENFDPCVYKILNPDMAFSGTNPFVHFLQSAKKIETAHPRKYSVLFPNIRFTATPRVKSKEIRLVEYDRISPEDARSFAGESYKTFTFRSHNYVLYAPDSDYLLEAIKKNKALKIVRYTHGAFDRLYDFFKVSNEIRRQIGPCLSEEELINLTSRLCLEQGKGIEPHWQIFTENYFLELIKDLQQVKTNTKIMHAAAFIGYPSKDNRPFLRPDATIEKCEKTRGSVEVFSRYFSPGVRIFDGTYFKRGVISGGFKELPLYLKKHPVLVMGPIWFADLGRKWELEKYLHLPIHWEGAFLRRQKLLKRCRDALGALPRSKEIPVFFFQVGSISAWLISRLVRNFPEVMYLDVGQAINAWALEEPFNSQIYAWGRTYRKPMVVNLGLEGFYKKACGAHYEAWINLKTI